MPYEMCGVTKAYKASRNIYAHIDISEEQEIKINHLISAI